MKSTSIETFIFLQYTSSTFCWSDLDDSLVAQNSTVSLLRYPIEPHQVDMFEKCSTSFYCSRLRLYRDVRTIIFLCRLFLWSDVEYLQKYREQMTNVCQLKAIIQRARKSFHMQHVKQLASDS